MTSYLLWLFSVMRKSSGLVQFFFPLSIKPKHKPVLKFLRKPWNIRKSDRSDRGIEEYLGVRWFGDHKRPVLTATSAFWNGASARRNPCPGHILWLHNRQDKAEAVRAIWFICCTSLNVLQYNFVNCDHIIHIEIQWCGRTYIYRELCTMRISAVKYLHTYLVIFVKHPKKVRALEVQNYTVHSTI